MEVNTPGQNMLWGMSEHDGGRLATLSHRGTERSCMLFFQGFHTSVPRAANNVDLKPNACKSNPYSYIKTSVRNRCIV